MDGIREKNKVDIFAASIKDELETDNISEIREAIFEYIESGNYQDIQALTEATLQVVTSLRREMGLTVNLNDSKDLIVSYRNKSEIYYWLQSQINEILACGTYRYKDNHLVSQVYKYIVSNITNADANLNNIANHFSVSNSHLSRQFKKQLGRNYVDIVSDLRMAGMLELLNTTKMKDRDIGEMIGIYDPHYLSIWFKKITGLSPSDYRRINNQVKY